MDITELKRQNDELKYILYSITASRTSCCDSSGTLDQSHNKEYHDLLKTYKNIPDDLTNCEVDMKSCLYEWIGFTGYETPVLLGYIDDANKTFYKIESSDDI